MIKKLVFVVAFTALTAMAFATSALAVGIMPSFATVPTGWATDRYDPASFSNIGPYQGRSNALGISIDSSTNLANRPSPYQFTFYNTQGRQYAFSPAAGPGSMLSADLYIPSSWSVAANGNVRSDMWGVMIDGSNAISAYSIIGFTNYGGAPRLRVWDDDLNDWVDLAAPINYDAWNRFSIELMADMSFHYFVNGAPVFTDSSTASSVAFSAVIMQAYNFADPSIVPAPVVADYTAAWANTTLVVDTDGQASETDCSATDSAFSTIQSAINASGAGDDIRVCPGTYNESPAIPKSLTLQSTAGRDATTIQLNTSTGGYPYGAIYVSGSGSQVTIDGFTIRGNDGTASTIGTDNVIFGSALGNAVLSNNRILIGKRDLVVDGEDSVGILTNYNSGSSSLTMTGNIIDMVTTGAAQRPFYINPGLANFTFQNNQINGNFNKLAVTEADTSLIDNNVYTGTGNAGSGFGVNNGPPSPTYVGSTFSNNLVSNVGTGLYVGTYAPTSNAVVKSNSFVNDGDGVFIDTGSSASEIDFNRFIGNTNGVNNASGAVAAENNWWGCNYGPAATGPGCTGTTNGVTGTVDADPWLVLTTAATSSSFVLSPLDSPDAVYSYLTTNSDNATPVGGAVRDGIPASFVGTLGTVTPPTSSTGVNGPGTTGTFFTGTMAGLGGVATTIDGQTVNAPIAVYPGACAALSMPDVQSTPGVPITVPVNTTEMALRNALSADFTITYDPAVLTPSAGAPFYGVSLGPVGTSNGGGRVLTVANPTPGTLNISVFGTSELQGSGALVNLGFNVTPGLPMDVSPMQFASFTYNEGVPCSNTTDGSVTVIGGTITGTVTYANVQGTPNPRYVDNVIVTGAGTPTVTSTPSDTFGTYSLSGFGPGTYTRSAAKTGGIPAGTITAFDSAKIAQHVVGTITLTATQLIVADVSGAGGVTSFDAALIARYSINLTTDIGSSGTWRFTPLSYGPSTVYSDMTENYSAYLMGDVTGNWNQGTSLPGGRPVNNGDAFGRQPSIVSAPVTKAAVGSEVNIPIGIKGTAERGIVSYNFELNYDPQVLAPAGTVANVVDTVSAGMFAMANTDTPGVLRVAVFGPAPISGDGVLLSLRFKAVGSAGAVSPLTWTDLMLNEGGPESTAIEGSVTLTPSRTPIVIGHFMNGMGRAIAGVQVMAVDTTGRSMTAVTDKSGMFTFADVEMGQTYTITTASEAYRFAPVTVSVTQDRTTVDLIAASAGLSDQ